MAIMANQIVLDKLASECAEVIHIITKIQMFGLYSFNPNDPMQTTNEELLQQELGDLRAALQFTVQANFITPEQMMSNARLACTKVCKYHDDQLLYEARKALNDGFTNL